MSILEQSLTILQWSLVFGAFFMKDRTFSTMFDKSIKSIFTDFQAIINNKDDKDLKMTTLLTKPSYGVDKGNDVPQTPVMLKLDSIITMLSDLTQEVATNTADILSLKEVKETPVNLEP